MRNKLKNSLSKMGESKYPIDQCINYIDRGANLLSENPGAYTSKSLLNELIIRNKSLKKNEVKFLGIEQLIKDLREGEDYEISVWHFKKNNSFLSLYYRKQGFDFIGMVMKPSK